MGNAPRREATEFARQATLDCADVYDLAAEFRRKVEARYSEIYEADILEAEDIAEMSKFRDLAHEAFLRVSDILAVALQLWRHDVPKFSAAKAPGFRYRPLGFATASTLYASVPDEDGTTASILALPLGDITNPSELARRIADVEGDRRPREGGGR